MDTYKYIEVKKGVFLKYKVQIVQLHSIITKWETCHNIQVSLLFPQTLYNIVHCRSKEERSHSCWFLPVESVHTAVNITNEVFLVHFHLKSSIRATFGEMVITTEESVVVFSVLALMPLSHLNHNHSVIFYFLFHQHWVVWGYLVHEQDEHYSEQENSHHRVYTWWHKEQALAECGEVSPPSFCETKHSLYPSSSAWHPAAVC